ncbi:MAG: hypothetical protein NWF05_02680 [Candidatus Bathyarchaeota archaeon]|nr:hypothetical protein [Candidatus Bathyarchaeota archaeon]
MLSINVLALSVLEAEKTLVLLRKGNKLALVRFSNDFSIQTELAVFEGTDGRLLFAEDDTILLAIAEHLILFKNNVSQTVLTACAPKNFFWHACSFHDLVVVQEYGSSPTFLYTSKDLLNWTGNISSLNVDKNSTHFHNVVYDAYRDQLIATLGDANLVRVICSDDCLKWRPMYVGAWQFLPIVPLNDQLVFGMDSALAKGGIGRYFPSENKWQFTFLKWVTKTKSPVQMCDLKKLTNGYWVAALFYPPSIIFSKDLKTWFPLYVDYSAKLYNFNMYIAEGKESVICSTGKNLIVIKKNELSRIILHAEPIVSDHQFRASKFVGLAWNMKKKMGF